MNCIPPEKYIYLQFMALKIRLQRMGTKNAPVFRIVVAESSARRDGPFVEALGHYNPRARKTDPKIKLNTERYNYWKSVGAQPSETVDNLAFLAAKGEVKDGFSIVLQKKEAAAA